MFGVLYSVKCNGDLLKENQDVMNPYNLQVKNKNQERTYCLHCKFIIPVFFNSFFQQFICS